MNVFLIHGPNPVEIQEERIRIVDALLPAEQRDENLTEFNPPGSRPLKLSALLPDLLAELGTVSFFPGARRVAIVNDLSDFWAGGEAGQEEPLPAAAAKKRAKSAAPADPSERLIRYLEQDFSDNDAALIFTVFEDPEKRRSVDVRRKLAKWIKENGKEIAFKGQPLIFQIDDAILRRDLPSALGLFRQGYRRGQTDQAMGLFYAIVRTVRFLLQAKIAGAARQRGLTDEFLAAELLPDDARSNLMKIHAFPRGKYLKAAPAFSASDLMEALQSLYEINRCLIPSADDLYVADVGFLFEKLLIQLCGGMRSAAPN